MKATCTRCNQTKPLEEFRIHKRRKAHRSQCKQCEREKQALRQATPKGKAKQAWYNMNLRCSDGRYPNTKVLCTQQEFLEWAIPLFEQFAQQFPDETPSIHRLDPDDHYRLDNMAVVSLSDNSREARCTPKSLAKALLANCRTRGISINEVLAELALLEVN